MRTKAAVLFQPNEPIRIIELEIPVLKPGQVLVEIAYSGICQTQLLEVRGKRGKDIYLPHCLGHEASGIVVDIGPAVTKVKPDDYVVLSWIKGSGADVQSTIYKTEGTKFNSGAITTFSKYTVVSENRLTCIDESMPKREAALLGCAVPTGVGSVLNSAQVRPNESVVVLGVGGVGLCSVMGADIVSAQPIIAVDLNKHKLELALSLGATHTINANNEDPVEIIKEITNGQGVKYAIETSGVPKVMEQGFAAVQNRTGLLIIVGNAPYGELFSLNPHDFNMGKRVYGTWGGDTQPNRDIPMYVVMYLSGKLKLDALITHVYKMDEINHAFNDLEKGNVIGRALIDMTEN